MASKNSSSNLPTNPSVTGYTVSAVKKRLEKGSMSNKLELVKILTNSMPKANHNVDDEILPRAYAVAIEDLPEYRLQECVMDLISGRAGVKWLPMPNELGIMVRAKMRFDEDFLARQNQQQALEAVPDDFKRTPEELDRMAQHVSKALEKFHAGLTIDPLDAKTTDDAPD